MYVTNIGRFAWCICETNDIDDGCFGITEPDTLTIKLRTNIYVQNRMPTLVHELCHAFMYSYGLYIGSDDSMDVEQACEFFGVHGEQIIKTATKIYKKIYEEQ